MPKAIALLGSLAALAMAGAAMASPNEQVVDTAGVVGFVPLRYGDHTVNAALASALEVDGYTFAAAVGDQFRIQFHTLTGGLDPSLVLRGPTGAILGSTSCNGNDIFGRGILCSTSLAHLVATAATYTLNVSDLGSDEAGAYQFHLDHYPPTNNWVGIAYGTANEVPDTLGHTTDSDYFAFNGRAGTGVRLTVRTTTGGLDPVMEVWGPAGQVLSNTVCTGNDIFGRPILCTNSIDLDVTATGVYKLGLTDAGWDEAGSYLISLNCQYGNCPTLAPMVPEPETYALMLGGIGLLGLALRRRRRH